MRCQLMIFDCDGTLVDSERIANEVFAELVTAEGLPTTFDDAVHRYMGRTASACIAEITEELGRPPRVDLLAERARLIDARLASELTAIDGVEDSVRAVAQLGIPRCVASSSTLEEIVERLTITGLLGYFGDDVFSATRVQNPKPAPDLFLHAAATMGARAEQCIVVEDSLSGVRAGKAAGMFTVGFADLLRPEILADAGADLVLADLRELPEALNLL